MTPYAVKNGDISIEELELFKDMRARVEGLSDTLLEGTELSCHHICHALSRLFDVEVADGRFDGMSKHSWLVLKRRTFMQDGENSLVIADMYPVAGVSAFLFYTAWCTPWKKLYTEDPEFLKEVTQHPNFSRERELVRGGLIKVGGAPLRRKAVA